MQKSISKRSEATESLRTSHNGNGKIRSRAPPLIRNMRRSTIPTSSVAGRKNTRISTLVFDDSGFCCPWTWTQKRLTWYVLLYRKVGRGICIKKRPAIRGKRHDAKCSDTSRSHLEVDEFASTPLEIDYVFFSYHNTPTRDGHRTQVHFETRASNPWFVDDVVRNVVLFVV